MGTLGKQWIRKDQWGIVPLAVARRLEARSRMVRELLDAGLIGNRPAREAGRQQGGQVMQKPALGVMGLVLGLVLLSGVAEAGMGEWPVIKQVSNVARCVVADSGSILTSLIGHVSGFAAETAGTVGRCLLYTVEQVTPGLTTHP